MTPKFSLDGFTIPSLKLSQNASGVGYEEKNWENQANKIEQIFCMRLWCFIGERVAFITDDTQEFQSLIRLVLNDRS